MNRDLLFYKKYLKIKFVMEKHLTKIVLILLIIFTLVNHFWGYIGHYGFDDMEYAKMAYNLNHGVYDVMNHYDFRWTIVGLTALSYQIFGINDFASSIPALLVFISTLLIVYCLVRKQKPAIAITAMFLTVFNYGALFYSDKLMPDNYVTLGVVGAIAALYYYRQNNNHAIRYALFFSISLLWALLSKETILLLAPVLLGIFLSDWFQKKHLSFWKYAIPFSITLFFLYFLLLKILFGSFVIRFESIVAGSYLNPCSYDLLPTVFLLKRITYELLLRFIEQYMAISIMFVAIAIIFSKYRSVLQANTNENFWLFTSALMLFSAQFMTISYKSYVPMCIDERHFYFLFPILAIASAPIIVDFFEQKKHGIWLFALMLIIIFTGYYNNNSAIFYLYMPIAFLILLRIVLPVSKKTISTILISMFFLVFLIYPIEKIYKAQDYNYPQQRQTINKILKEIKGTACIITNPVEKRLCDYYLQFNPQNLTIVEYDSVATLPTASNVDYYVLNNYHTMILSGLNPERLPSFAREVNEIHQLIFQEQAIQLFKLNKPMISTTCTFDENKPYWRYNESDLVIDPENSSNKVQKAPEYAATFTFKADSIKQDFYAKIAIRFMQNKASEANIVLSVEDSLKKNYIWQGFKLDEFSKVYGKWNIANIDRTFLWKDIVPSSTVNIYVWNTKQKSLLIDDFKVELFWKKE